MRATLILLIETFFALMSKSLWDLKFSDEANFHCFYHPTKLQLNIEL